MTLPPPRAAYLHVPFCLRRCFYCDFPVVPLGDKADGSRNAAIPRYLEALQAEIRASAPGPPLSTVYFGGGTPSLLTADQVEGLLETLRERYGLAPGAEITLEMDPATFDHARLDTVLRAGVNRVSLGGQSLDDAVLRGLGRHHRRHHLLEAAGWLRQARREGGLRSWSLDLIQGVPSLPGAPSAETPDACRAHWREQLEQAIALRPPHLSVYELTLEPGTVFARRRERGALDLPDEELGADLLELTTSRLRAAGYGRYEVSNHAWPGHASRHNRVYWSGMGWRGFGMGATSAPRGRRFMRPRTREGYEAWLREGPDAEGEPAAAFPLDERVMVGLRRREGINLAELWAREGWGTEALDSLREHLTPWIASDLLRIEGDRWRLTDPRGLDLSSAVLRAFMGWWLEQPGGRRDSAADASTP
ncbi:MAG: coproporphyrinogen-III oxidase family protein [Cyanobacteriota bacterium]|nr:coproporphyrinogen-III oxidase family protein [Cyanobacteriota bacterium]